jgi:hypothetical protein
MYKDYEHEAIVAQDAALVKKLEKKSTIIGRAMAMLLILN